MALHGGSTSDLTGTEQEAYRIVEEEFSPLYDELKQMYEADLVALEKQLDSIGAPLTPVRFPTWKK